MNFWTRISRFILKNQLFILLTIAVITVFLGSQTKHIKFSYTEANLLPEGPSRKLELFPFFKCFSGKKEP
jgi:predicted RND superfamily exporter protein